jgi:hypothetical protein
MRRHRKYKLAMPTHNFKLFPKVDIPAKSKKSEICKLHQNIYNILSHFFDQVLPGQQAFLHLSG